MPKSNNGNHDLPLPPEVKWDHIDMSKFGLPLYFGNSVIGGNCYKDPCNMQCKLSFSWRFSKKKLN